MVVSDTCGYKKADAYIWVPVETLSDGKSNIALLTERLQSGAPIDQEVTVEATESTSDEKHIARCSVRSVKGLSGPPRECATVAIATPSRTWFRAADPKQSCVRGAEFRLSGAIRINFEVNTTLKPPDFSSGILRALEHGFSLSATKEDEKDPDGTIAAVSLESVSPLRTSQILTGGWREALDFDVNVSQEAQIVEVRGTAHVMVSRQAVSQLTEYSGLSDAQRSIYATALNDGIERAILDADKSCHTVDSTHIACR
jgi:hypothetical protein